MADTLVLYSTIGIAQPFDSSGRPVGLSAFEPYGPNSINVGAFEGNRFTLANVGDSQVISFANTPAGTFFFVSASAQVRILATISGGNIDVHVKFYVMGGPVAGHEITGCTIFADVANTTVDVVVGQ